VRWEYFPSGAEVLAVGTFYKRLYDPIEETLRPGDEPFLQPFNSEKGRNLGVELEARAQLGRLWKPLEPLFVNANLSLISSRVTLSSLGSSLVSAEHQLEGQASYLFNGALSWTAPGGSGDASLLMNVVGKRLDTIGPAGMDDFYHQPVTTLDAALNWKPIPGWRMKLSGKNLLDAENVTLQGDRVTYRSKLGRGLSVSLGYGS
jgi:outer membrane receptor protein involved in Fe transport